MIILSELNACFVGIPKTGSVALSQFLEAHARRDGDTLYDAERLHDFHATLEEAAPLVPFALHDLWTFAVVRNPFDRLVSYCAGHDPDFAVCPRDVLRKHLESAMDNRWTYPQTYFLGGVRTVYRFETLGRAAQEIMQRLGIECSAELPVANASDHDPYVHYFDGELKALAEQVYAEDLARFSYRF